MFKIGRRAFCSQLDCIVSKVGLRHEPNKLLKAMNGLCWFRLRPSSLTQLSRNALLKRYRFTTFRYPPDLYCQNYGPEHTLSIYLRLMILIS